MKVIPRDKLPAVLAIAILAASFLGVAVSFPPVHAATPTISNACQNDTGGAASSVTVTCTIGAIGDVIAVFGQTLNFVGGSGTLYTVSTVTSTAVSGGFTEFLTVQGYCQPDVGFCGGAGNPNQPFFNSVWIGVATAAGAGKTFVITGSGTASDMGGQGYDMVNVNSTPSFYSTGVCNAVKNNDCGSPMVTSGPANPIVASVYLAGAVTRGSAVGTAGSQFSLNSAVANTGGEFAQNTLVPPTSFPLNFNGGSGVNSGYALIGITFSQESAVTVTSVINTNCLGACSGGANATSTYFSTAIPSLFVFYQSQNTGSQGQIDNFTMKVKSVHITTQSGTLLIGIYMPVTPTTAPSGGNQYTLVKSLTYPITNGATDFFIHQNPQANICSSCFYAAGIMATTTADSTPGATGSGVSFYETSGATSQQFSFNPGGTSLPTTFFSATVQRPNFFMYVHESYTVATVTTTSTLTLSGLVTSTSTVTTTSTNIINQLDMSKAGFWFLPLLFLLAPMALLIVVKRVADGR